jgi:hypothetical protein
VITERIGEGNHWKVFINTYNQRSQDYSDYGFIGNEPDYRFLRYFGEFDNVEDGMANSIT